MLPNYIVIGAAKCGTTSICDLLGRHPDVFMSSPKEIHYFGRDNSERPMAWYEEHFEKAGGATAIGEGSTSYTHPEIIEACVSQIAEHIPDCRLIYMVRNPLTRLESDWKLRKRLGWAEGPVNEAVERQDSLISHGMYWQNLNVYRKRFSEEQIRVVFLEDFSQDPTTELKRCFTHIGVDPNVESPDADRPRNSAVNLRSDGRIASRLRQSRFFETAKRLTPAWALTASKAVLLKKQDLTLEWDPAVRESVLDRLRPDSDAFLDYCGKPADFWG